MNGRITHLVLAGSLFVLAIPVHQGAAAEEGDAAASTYRYLYQGRSVSMKASPSRIAVREAGAAYKRFVSENALQRDPTSEHPALRDRGLAIYRATARTKHHGSSQAAPVNLADVARALAENRGGVVQPVFEQGMAWHIPWDEVIVDFVNDTTPLQARSYLKRFEHALGLGDVRGLRKNTFIVTIADPAMGRVFEVSRALAGQAEVNFAEPNHLVVQPCERPGPLMSMNREPISREEAHAGQPTQFKTSPSTAQGLDGGPVTWVTIAEADFEDGTTGDFSVWLDPVAEDAQWGVTPHRAHGGARSLYCAEVGTATPGAPGPAPTNMFTRVESPTFDMTHYEEIYLELWFWAINELNPNIQYYDWAYVLVKDVTADFAHIVPFADLAVTFQEDCTVDPTTEGGWRRMLVRIPPNLHLPNAHVDIAYDSDLGVQREGCYVDDLRLVATTNVDALLSADYNDTYANRQYELKNAGQIAGLGDDTQDLNVPEAWDLVTIDPALVVAVIDSGVELTHPDLNLVPGYDWDGTTGGGPPTRTPPGISHGTKVAGNLGAIRNNAVGVVGTAPGVKIMPVYEGATLADRASAIDVAVANGAKVLNNSWGAVGDPIAVQEQAILDALAANRVVLFPAGDGPGRAPYSYEVDFPGYMAGYSDVICVGASSPTDEHKSASSSDGQHSWGSSFLARGTGDGPDVCAPGSWSYSTDLLGADGTNPNAIWTGVDADYTHEMYGTSSSTPKVAGIVALMLSANPSLSPGQVKQMLKDTAVDIESPGWDDKTGWGRVDALAAVQAALAAPVIFRLTASAGADGAISPNGTIMVDGGAGQSFTATPDGGFEVDVWLLDGATDQVGGSSYPLTNIQANHTIHVNFKVIGGGNHHPADTNDDWILSEAEATAYGDAWRAGHTWPEGPAPIHIDYVTRAGQLWQHGGGQYMDNGDPRPLGWVPAP